MFRKIIYSIVGAILLGVGGSVAMAILLDRKAGGENFGAIILIPMILLVGGIAGGVGGNFLARYINKREEEQKLINKPQ